MMTRFTSKKGTAILFLVLLFSLPLGAVGVADIVSLFTTITGTLKDDIGKVLTAIQTVKNAESTLKQQVVWPVAAINQAKSSALQVRSQWANLAAQIRSIPVSSASLPNPKQLESLLRSSQSTNIGSLQPRFQQVYGSIPLASYADANERNLSDVDDALAAGSLKKALASEQITRQMLGVADQLEQQAGAASPGSAPLLTAQASVVSLQNQAFLQQMLAAELRQEAGRLAHDNAALKRSAESTRSLRNGVQQILNRR